MSICAWGLINAKEKTKMKYVSVILLVVLGSCHSNNKIYRGTYCSSSTTNIHNDNFDSLFVNNNDEIIYYLSSGLSKGYYAGYFFDGKIGLYYLGRQKPSSINYNRNDTLDILNLSILKATKEKIHTDYKVFKKINPKASLSL